MPQITIEPRPTLQTTFIAESEHARVEIGDATSASFVPQIKIAKWANQANVSCRLIVAEPGVLSLDGPLVVYRTSSLQARWYSKDDVETNDGHEFEVEFLRPPTTNVLTFSVHDKGVASWDYQAPLANLDDDGSTWEPNPWGGIRRRPAHVNGSYAVYGDRCGDYRALGGHNYRTGKILHIYRPWAEDAAGVRVWCDLHYDAGSLTIAIPQDFLDHAEYPVLVDPTFGYSGTAASDDNIGQAHLWSKAVTTPAGNGALTSMTLKGRLRFGSISEFEPAIYADNGSGYPAGKLAGVDSGGTVFGSSDAEVTTNISYSSLAAGTQYWLAFRDEQGNGVSFDAWFKYDASGGNANAYYGVPAVGTDWEATAPGGLNVLNNEKIYIYGTYTETGTTISPGAGALSFTGAALSVLLAGTVALGAGSLAYTGRTPTVSVGGAGTTIQIPAGAVAYTGALPALVFGGPSTGVLTFTGYAPTVLADKTIPIGVGAIAYTGQTPSLQYDIRRDLSAGSLTFSGLVPTSHLNVVVAMPSGALTYTGQTPSLGGARTLTPGAGQITYVGLAPTVVFSGAVSPSAGAIVFSGLAPTIGLSVAVPVGALSYATQAPVLDRGIPIGVGTLSFTGYAATPDVVGSFTPALGAGSLTWTGQLPTVANSGIVTADSTNIRRALIAKLRADSTLATLLPDGIWFNEAPQGSRRFGVVSLVDATIEGEFQRDAYEDHLYLVKAVVLKSTRGDAEAAAARIRSVLQDQTLDITGYTFMVMYLEDPIADDEVDDIDETVRWLHRGGQYRVQATRLDT